ncbi:putative DNA binding domain-containing protein [Candidatus Sumerlaeota bacterium]|nr:putative DNA binding domain-containing protein [Candidatus Sumerlaeota bacterium]
MKNEAQYWEDCLTDVENHSVERKESPADKNELRRQICAFANDLPDCRQPGILIIGATDKGEYAGLEITDQLLTSLSEMRSDGKILPFPMLRVEKKTILSHDYAIISVEPSNSPPVRMDGRVWVRVGPTLRQATREEEIRLAEKRRYKDLSFDLTPVESASIEDFDKTLFADVYLRHAVAPEVLEENERTFEQQLSSLRMIRSAADPLPTVTGILTIGADPLQYLPGAYVQFLRIQGVEATDPIKDRKEISGPLIQVLRMLDELINVNVEIRTEIARSNLEIQTPDYPIAAIQQVIRNAILHRNYDSTNAPVRMYWYQDRIEIISPGGAYGQVNDRNFGQPGVTDYRNPTLAEVMRNLGYVQKFGMGIPIAKKEMAQNGNPELEFNFQSGIITAILRRRPEHTP